MFIRHLEMNYLSLVVSTIFLFSVISVVFPFFLSFLLLDRSVRSGQGEFLSQGSSGSVRRIEIAVTDEEHGVIILSRICMVFYAMFCIFDVWSMLAVIG